MRYLVDTHVWLWMLTAPEQIQGEAAVILEDPRSALLLSAASSWEIAIKYAIGRLPLPEPPDSYVPGRMRSSGIDSLPVTHTHALRVAVLPRHHDDPFDRMLVAQAQIEGLTVITADPALSRYDLPVLFTS